MLVRKLREMLDEVLENYFDEDKYEAYEELDSTDLSRIDLYYHSHAKQRDGDYFVITKNEPLEREIVDGEGEDEGKKFYGTIIHETWTIEDYDENIYYVNLVSDADLTEEVK